MYLLNMHGLFLEKTEKGVSRVNPFQEIFEKINNLLMLKIIQILIQRKKLMTKIENLRLGII